jgi:hypothetical protein
MGRDDYAVVVLTSCGVNYSLIRIGLDDTPTGDNSLRSKPLQLRFEPPLSCVGFGLLGWDEDIHFNVTLLLGVRANCPRQSGSPEGVIDYHQVAHRKPPFVAALAVPGPLPADADALPRRCEQITWSQPSCPPAGSVQRVAQGRPQPPEGEVLEGPVAVCEITMTKGGTLAG